MPASIPSQHRESDFRRLGNPSRFRSVRKRSSAVVFAHINADGGIALVPEQIGSYGVLLFFILSGFLMGHLYLGQPFEKDRVARYFAARISRILPLYYTVGLASFIYSRFDPNFFYYMTPLDAVRHIFAISNVSVFWTIAPEFQFYFCFPILWWLGSQPRRISLPIGVILGTVTIVLIAFRYQLPGLLVISKLHIFLLGIAIALAAPLTRAKLSESAATIIQLIAVAIMLSLIFPPTADYHQWLYLDGEPDRLARYYYEFPRVLMMGLCVFAFATSDTAFARAVFGNAVGRNLGKLSFSLYLLHTPVIYMAIALDWFSTFGVSLTVALILIISYVISALSHKWFEEPSRRAGTHALLHLFNSARFGERHAAA
ncbi:acyltransferase family protein [Novosphingobium sp. M1R2S20]|uniref:Acyltransferase family protein n=1 Tax=Novosphingobium rhizovicinum TaxID=3228928 RepID=A0ABV3R7B9_9SPHN